MNDCDLVNIPPSEGSKCGDQHVSKTVIILLHFVTRIFLLNISMADGDAGTFHGSNFMGHLL